MLKKMRWRFIASAMASFAAVTVILIIGINIINHIRIRNDEDRVIDMLTEYEQAIIITPDTEFPIIEDIPGAGGREAEFITRFFSVHYDSSGRVSVISRDHISSINSSTALEYSESVIIKGDERGYLNDYRYRITHTSTGVTVLFLNIANDRAYMSSLMWTSIIIGMIALALVFALIMLFSNRAIRPFIKNMERQKRFITDAGHELKTPITSISTSADILSMDDGDNEWIKNIQNQTSLLSKLVNELVMLSRFDEGNESYEKESFSLSEVAWEVSEPFAAIANAKGYSYSQDIQDGMTIKGNRHTISQLISIFLDNAIKYTNANGTIHFSAYKKHSKFYIDVMNSCVLPDIEDLNRLFDRFYRPDDSRSKKTGGSGIGLSVAQAIVELHGGKISASKVGDNKILFRAII